MTEKKYCECCKQEIKIKSKRTLRQNASLHKLLSDLSQICIEKGIDMNVIVKKVLKYNALLTILKMLWRLLQEELFGTKSTTQLKKSGEIDIVYNNFNKIIIERTKGEVELPPWPSMDSLIRNTNN